MCAQADSVDPIMSLYLKVKFSAVDFRECHPYYYLQTGKCCRRVTEVDMDPYCLLVGPVEKWIHRLDAAGQRQGEYASLQAGVCGLGTQELDGYSCPYQISLGPQLGQPI